jgi:hypothetical protein
MAKKRMPEFYYKAVEGSSARAKYTHHAATIHRIEFSFVTENGEKVIVEMDHETAAKLIEEGIAAYTAIQRPIQFPRFTPFG